MYKGYRDPELRVIVPANKCWSYTDRNGKEWVEIFVPPEKFDDYKQNWGSIMVSPTQVYSMDDAWNVVELNDGTQIINSCKNRKRDTIWKEMLSPQQITGRFLKFYYFCRFRGKYPREPESNALYNDMISVGQMMDVYMNRLPWDLPVAAKEENQPAFLGDFEDFPIVRRSRTSA